MHIYLQNFLLSSLSLLLLKFIICRSAYLSPLQHEPALFGFLFACPGYRAEIVKTDTIAVLLVLAIYSITPHHSESDQGRAAGAAQTVGLVGL